MNITLEEFQKVEVRVGTVLSATKAEGADKLIKFIFDFGTYQSQPLVIPVHPSGQEEGFTPLPELAENYPGRDVRQVMSAIAEFYPDPEVLVGKQICVCTNLEPRTFRGHESQGMILAVDNPAGGIIFIGPEEKAPAGAKLH